jgi:hypothetical protein
METPEQMASTAAGTGATRPSRRSTRDTLPRSKDASALDFERPPPQDGGVVRERDGGSAEVLRAVRFVMVDE